MLRVPNAMIRWPLTDLEGGEAGLVSEGRSVIWLLILASVVWPRCWVKLDVCPDLSQLWLNWVQITEHFLMMIIIIRGWFVSVPEVGAGKVWWYITSILVPGSLCIID